MSICIREREKMNFLTKVIIRQFFWKEEVKECVVEMANMLCVGRPSGTPPEILEVRKKQGNLAASDVEIRRAPKTEMVNQLKEMKPRRRKK